MEINFNQDLQELVKKIYSERCNNFLTDILTQPIQNLFGRLKVYEVPKSIPKLKLSNQVDVSPEFRKEFDQWLLDQFGYKDSLLRDGEVLISEKYGTVMMTPYTKSLLNIKV